MSRSLLIILYLLFHSFFTNAQELPVTEEQQLETVTEVTESDVEDEMLLQQLQYYIENPLNLNAATEEELRSLFILTDLQIYNLLQYRKLAGALVSIYELQAVPSWNLSTIKRVLPYVTISIRADVAQTLIKRLRGGKHFVMLRGSKLLQKQRGYDKTLSTHYLGSNEHLQLRYKFQHKNLLHYGIVADKDAGEEFFKGSQQKGFDFYSFHLFARKIGIVKALALGDFTVNMGQGLIQWQSFAFKKSADAMFIKRQGSVLHPYSSAGEFYFTRGAGASFHIGKVEATVFGGYRKFSGNLVNDTMSNESYFSSFQTSGYHRSASELADRNRIRQISFGGTVGYRRSNYTVNLNTVHYNFSKAIQKREEPYNQFAIQGNRWSNYSIDYSITYKNLHFFGEAAIDKNVSTAFVNGMQISVDPKVDISLLYRNINPEYQAVFGNAFTESTAPSNERGFYTGITLRPVNGWRVDAYADFFQFPWLKYRVNAPSKGSDYQVQLQWQPDKQFEAYARYKQESKPINASISSDPIDYPVNQPKENLRFHFQYVVNKNLVLRTRTEFLWFHRKDAGRVEDGFLTYVEARYRAGMKLAGNLRMAYFETDSYNSRIYAYESDVLYSYSIPAFFNKGNRIYLNINYDLTIRSSIWLRFAHTIYNGMEKIGSGLDEIEGNRRSEIKIQFRYAFGKG